MMNVTWVVVDKTDFDFAMIDLIRNESRISAKVAQWELSNIASEIPLGSTEGRNLQRDLVNVL